MSNDCSTGIVIPTLPNDTCPTGRISTECVLNSSPITYLSTPANEKQSVINDKLVLSLADARNRIQFLESQNLNVDNTTLTPLTLIQLNTLYPTALLGFEVQCVTISTIYKKTTLGWVSHAITNVI
jgi:hypothetical protein